MEHTNIPEPVSWALTVGPPRLGPHVWAPARLGPSTFGPHTSKLQHDGHLYTFAKTSADGTTKFWRCEYKNSGEDKCKGRFWTSLRDEFIRIATPHTLNGIQVTSLRKKSRLPSKGVLL
ncbi:hypothetical protein niasHT_030355 [Heterodera trifolii]|uniref:FLYWCH-type domain-containing protein n=1 Tax=Heterodera trifolii TaxID=157864 RepID=A0ABD2KRA7_9BILA